jgi:hypothetical protein
MWIINFLIINSSLIKRKRPESERKNEALDLSTVSSNETMIGSSSPLNSGDITFSTSSYKAYTRISSILINDNHKAGSQRARAAIITTATATATATPSAIATIIATATATATATAIATHTFFDPTAVLPPIDDSLYQNNGPRLHILEPDHVMKEQTYRFPFPW